ncbi:hypothetical protein, partial [Ensifer sp. OV372]|uniref:hypothetical protein n=1 Tax=Ensifer sp. OV372 TaxID=1855293 RepID=UPI001FCE0CB4
MHELAVHGAGRRQSYAALTVSIGNRKKHTAKKWGQCGDIDVTMQLDFRKHRAAVIPTSPYAGASEYQPATKQLLLRKLKPKGSVITRP